MTSSFPLNEGDRGELFCCHVSGILYLGWWEKNKSSIQQSVVRNPKTWRGPSEARAEPKPTNPQSVIRNPTVQIGLPPSASRCKPLSRNQLDSSAGEGEARAERGLSPSPALYPRPEPRSATEQVALRRGSRIVYYVILLHSDEAPKGPSRGVELRCGAAEPRSGALLHSDEAAPIRIICGDFQWK